MAIQRLKSERVTTGLMLPPEFSFKVRPREELEEGYQVPRNYIDAANVSSRIPSNNPENGGITGNPPNNPYNIDNLETLPRDPSTQIPRGSLNQPSPQDLLGNQIAETGDRRQETGNGIRPRVVTPIDANQGSRERFVGQPTLDDEVAKSESYLNELRLAPVENRNSRWKSFLKSLGYGLSAFGQRPVQDWSDFAYAGGQALGTGLYGLFDKSLDERFGRQNEITREEENYARLTERQKREQEREGLLYKRLSDRVKLTNDEKDRLIRIYNDLTDFDPETNQEHAALALQMKALGLPAAKKTPSDRFSLQIAPDGTPIVVNTRTGETIIKEGNYQRPVQLKDSDLPDEAFGLPSKDELTNLARSRVSILPSGRRLIPEIAKSLPNEVTYSDGTTLSLKNPDGSINEQNLLQAIGEGNLSYSLSQIYENIPADTERKIAEQRAKEEAKWKPLKAEVAKFRARLLGNKPKQGAQPTNRAEVIELFNEIMAIKDQKQRQAALAQFYNNLSNLQIQ